MYTGRCGAHHQQVLPTAELSKVTQMGYTLSSEQTQSIVETLFSRSFFRLFFLFPHLLIDHSLLYTCLFNIAVFAFKLLLANLYPFLCTYILQYLELSLFLHSCPQMIVVVHNKRELIYSAFLTLSNQETV